MHFSKRTPYSIMMQENSPKLNFLVHVNPVREEKSFMRGFGG